MNKILFARVALVGLIGAAALVVIPVTVFLPPALDGSSYRCGGVTGMIREGRTGYQGGEQADGVYEFVVAHCPPAAILHGSIALALLIIGVAALVTAISMAVRDRRRSTRGS